MISEKFWLGNPSDVLQSAIQEFLDKKMAWVENVNASRSDLFLSCRKSRPDEKMFVKIFADKSGGRDVAEAISAWLKNEDIVIKTSASEIYEKDGCKHIIYFYIVKPQLAENRPKVVNMEDFRNGR